ncbi:Ced-6 protein, partial [Operophtera brumata]
IEVVKDAIKKLQFSQQLKKSEAKDGANSLFTGYRTVQTTRAPKSTSRLSRKVAALSTMASTAMMAPLWRNTKTVTAEQEVGATDEHVQEQVTAYLARHHLSDIAEFKPPAELAKQLATLTMANGDSNHGQSEHVAPPPKASKRQSTPVQAVQPIQMVQPSPPVNGNDLFGSTPFSAPQPHSQFSSPTNRPNYDISDFNLSTSVFNSSTNSFTNGLSGYDPFDTQKGNIFGNGYGNTFNGFGNLSEKQTVELDKSFNGFLDKTITEMKDGFSRGITFGNDDFSIDNLDPLKKN